MNEQDYEQLTLFQADSPASHFPWLESKKAKGMTVTSGRKCLELSENLRRVGYLVRTFLESSELPPGTWSRTWSVKDMTSRCLIMKLRLSERRTDGKESRLLPTVTATVADHGGPNQRDSSGRPGLQMAAMMWPTPAARDHKGSNSMEHLTRESDNRNHRDQLANAVKLWPTPTARNSKGASNTATRQGAPDLRTAVLYPTPTTGAGLCGGTGNYNQLKALEDAGEITPEERRSMAAGNGGQLNPDWVEAMMGFPPGWLNVDEPGQTEAGNTESQE